MPWVTEEEIQAAKNMTAYEYLRTHQAQRLQKTRTRNEWQLTDHDSFKINELSSKWHWKSRDRKSTRLNSSHPSSSRMPSSA